MDSATNFIKFILKCTSLPLDFLITYEQWPLRIHQRMTIALPPELRKHLITGMKELLMG